MTRPLLAPALAALALLACGSPSPSPDASAGDGASIEGVTWTLVALPEQTGLAEGAAPTLALDAATRRAAGDAGCNRYAGPYTLAGDSLRFGALVSTKRACASDARNAQETAFLRALDATRRWTLAGDTLRLLGDGGEVARMARPRAGSQAGSQAGP